MAGFLGMFNYAKEGPGVAKNAPKKRPFFAFMEIYGRKFWKLAMAGLLWTVTALPIVTRGWADAGLTFITRNFSREKHAFIKEDFFETVKKNRRNALIIGIINTIVTTILIFNLVTYIPVMMPGLYTLVGVAAENLPAARELNLMETIILALSLMGFVTFTWMKYYIPFLMITFKLNLKQVYKNAFLFAGANIKVNLLLTAILTVLYALLGGILMLSAAAKFNYLIWAAVLVLCVSVVPAFRSFLIQYSIFPAIKKLIIDPYYEQNPNADRQARLDLGLDVEETTAPAETAEEAEEVKPVEEEPIFVDTLPEKEVDAPKKVLPKQYNEKELRRFNRQVQSRVTDDDDDTI
ncbi:MAG: DUF624 domain-containing protein [Clostridia bacterium]|nr:DUF624 domain-containing protein [Clostridia bacterium]